MKKEQEHFVPTHLQELNDSLEVGSVIKMLSNYRGEIVEEISIVSQSGLRALRNHGPEIKFMTYFTHASLSHGVQGVEDVEVIGKLTEDQLKVFKDLRFTDFKQKDLNCYDLEDLRTKSKAYKFAQSWKA